MPTLRLEQLLPRALHVARVPAPRHLRRLEALRQLPRLVLAAVRVHVPRAQHCERPAVLVDERRAQVLVHAVASGALVEETLEQKVHRSVFHCKRHTRQYCLGIVLQPLKRQHWKHAFWREGLPFRRPLAVQVGHLLFERTCQRFWNRLAVSYAGCIVLRALPGSQMV